MSDKMLEEGAKYYVSVVKQSSVFSGIVFHIITGLFVAVLFFKIINFGSNTELSEVTIDGFTIKYNKEHFLLLHKAYLANHNLKIGEITPQLKAVEFMMLFFISIFFTAVASSINHRRRILEDALSKIRTAIHGEWQLRLVDFANTNTSRHDFLCKVVFGETEAWKLHAIFKSENFLKLDGSTPHVSLYVSTAQANPDKIELNFPLEGKIILDGDPDAVFYYISVGYELFKGQKNENVLEGRYYKIQNRMHDSAETGVACLARAAAK